MTTSAAADSARAADDPTSIHAADAIRISRAECYTAGMSKRSFVTTAFILSALVHVSHPTSAQEVVPPELQAPFESIMQEMRFENPTRIVARLMTTDAYENAIWVEWMSRHDGANWVPVPGRRQFKLLPRSPDMMDYFRTLKPGTSLKMTVQMDQDGNRRVLELDDAA